MNSDASLDVSYAIRSLEHALRAGYSLRQAVVRVSADIDELGGLARELDAGLPLVESFAAWAKARSEPDARLLVGAVRLQTEDEGNLADKFGLFHRILERC